jgi:hypothetical protein
MVSNTTLKARVAAELYLEAAYPPRWMAVDDLKWRIAPPAEQGSADSAIEQTARDDLAPVDYVDGSGDSAVALERGSRGQVNARVKDWIERHDSDELPTGLK